MALEAPLDNDEFGSTLLGNATDLWRWLKEKFGCSLTDVEPSAVDVTVRNHNFPQSSLQIRLFRDGKCCIQHGTDDRTAIEFDFSDRDSKTQAIIDKVREELRLPKEQV